MYKVISTANIVHTYFSLLKFSVHSPPPPILQKIYHLCLPQSYVPICTGKNMSVISSVNRISDRCHCHITTSMAHYSPPYPHHTHNIHHCLYSLSGVSDSASVSCHTLYLSPLSSLSYIYSSTL